MANFLMRLIALKGSWNNGELLKSYNLQSWVFSYLLIQNNNKKAYECINFKK